MAAFDSNFQLFFTVNSTQIAILHSVGLFMPALDSHMLAV